MENLEKPEKSETAETEEAPEFKGKNLEDAILHAEHKLKLPRTEFEYEVVTEKTRLFGLGKEVVIRAKVKTFGKSGDLTAFLDRLMNVALPRVRDFRGVSSKSFDGRGNYTLGLRDQLIFAEIDYAKVDKLKGMNVTIVTTAADDNGARALLKGFGMPFRVGA